MSAVYVNIISGALGLPARKVENTLALLKEGATIPFIARYRKEATGSLDEVQVAEIQKEFKRLEELDKRREAILHSIEEQGKLTGELRQKIEAHREDPNCAACHAKIDPLGLAWDNYDAIGQWRTREKIPAGVGEDPVINSSGAMPDGRAFKDVNEFKQRLLEDRDKLARAFIDHLCTYALRRPVAFDDQDDLQAIATEAKKSNYRIKDIVRAVAQSNLMKKR